MSSLLRDHPGPVTTPEPVPPVGRPDVALRLLTPDDGAALDTVFAGMSEQSRYLRFHVPMPSLPGRVRRTLLAVDGHDRIAVLAQARTHGRECPAGIARLDRTGPAEAEMAIALADRWHGQGIGRRLLTELAELARRAGYEQLHGWALPENHRILRLLQVVFPGAEQVWEDRVIRVSCTLASGTGSSAHGGPPRQAGACDRTACPT